MSTLFETTIEIDNIPFTAQYYYHEGEPQTHWYPGSSESVELKSIALAGEELSGKQAEFFIDKFGESDLNNFLIEDTHEQFEIASDMRADYEYEQMRDRRMEVAL